MLPSIRIDSWDDWTRVYNDVSVWRGLIDAICIREGHRVSATPSCERQHQTPSSCSIARMRSRSTVRFWR